MLNLPPRDPRSFLSRFRVGGGLIVALIVAVLLLSSVFVVSPSEEAGTRWLGGTPMTSVPLKTGVHFKVPFFETVDRIQTSRSVYTLNGLDVYTNYSLHNDLVTVA